MRRGGAPPNMKMDCRSPALLVTISSDGQPSFSLGTDVVDPLTINPFLFCKMLGTVSCAREAHLFSEQHRAHRDCTEKSVYAPPSCKATPATKRCKSTNVC